MTKLVKSISVLSIVSLSIAGFGSFANGNMDTQKSGGMNVDHLINSKTISTKTQLQQNVRMMAAN